MNEIIIRATINHNENENERVILNLVDRGNVDNRYTWCTDTNEDTGVCGETIDGAIEAAKLSWGADCWDLQLMTDKIKINYNDTTIITDRDIAAKFLDVDPDYMSDEHDWPDNADMKLVIEHNANTNTLQYAVVPADYNIGNVDVWDEDSIDDFGDDIDIVKNEIKIYADKYGNTVLDTNEETIIKIEKIKNESDKFYLNNEYVYFVLEYNRCDDFHFISNIGVTDNYDSAIEIAKIRINNRK